MKAFDLFQKVTVDNTSRPTLIGAILSVSAIIIMSYVLLKQLNEYFFLPLIQKDTIIFQDDNMTETVPVNIGLTFPNLPCSVISVDQEDLVGHHRLNIQDTLTKLPIDVFGVPNNNNFDGHRTSQLKEAIEKGEGCFLEGFIPISKVQGDIHISYHAYRDIFSYMLESGLSQKVSMAHKFSLFNFGDTTISKKILEQFELNELSDNFNRIENLPDFSKKSKEGSVNSNLDFDYFVKIIPQVFEDEYSGKRTVAYQYSLSSKAKTREDTLHMPIIMINYDYSPVGVKYTLKRRYFSHLITNICALVGGVFVIFSIINSIMNRLTETLEDDGLNKRRTIN